MLKNAREAIGLHIAALAVSLKVPVKKLEALEADRFDLLPDAVFVRGLAASVCRILKIDPAPVLQRLPQTSEPHLKSDKTGINVAFRSDAIGAGRRIFEQFSKPFVWVIAGLLLGAVALVMLPFTKRTEILGGPKTESMASADLALPMETTPSPDAAPAEAAPAEAASVASTASAPLAQSTVAGTGVSTSAVVFKAHAASWVEVVDARRVVQVRKTMSAGEVVGASGAMPLSVVVGRADTIEVVVGGQPFDLKPFVKENVARFEVK
jgi:cytoskeleton protein RodZ